MSNTLDYLQKIKESLAIAHHGGDISNDVFAIYDLTMSNVINIARAELENTHIWELSYTKYFNTGVTSHSKLSHDKNKLFEWMTTYCKQNNLILSKNESDVAEFIEADGGWTYNAYSNHMTVKFNCNEKRIL